MRRNDLMNISMAPPTNECPLCRRTVLEGTVSPRRDRAQEAEAAVEGGSRTPSEVVQYDGERHSRPSHASYRVRRDVHIGPRPSHEG